MSKSRKDLLQTGLVNCIFRYAVLNFVVFDISKKPTDCFAFDGNTILEEVTTLLNQINL